jgi:DNA-binding MarR family transcriptional regulator
VSFVMGEVRWLDDRERRAWRGLMAMHADLVQFTERRLRARHGLSKPDYEVLGLLGEAPPPGLRAVDLGRLLRWDKSRLSQHLTRMSGRGLIERARCPTDQRGTYVTLTDRGRELVVAAAGPHVEDVRAILVDHLTPAQMDVLAEVADLVRERVAALEESGPDQGSSASS